MRFWGNVEKRQTVSNHLQTMVGWIVCFIPPALVVGNAVSESLVALASLLFLAGTTIERDFSWLRKRWVQFGLAFWGYGVLRELLGGNASVGLYHVSVWIRYLLLGCCVAFWVFPDPLKRKRFIYALGATTLFLSLNSIVQYVRGVDFFGNENRIDRLTAIYSDKPIVGFTIASLFFPFAGYLLEEKKNLLATIWVTVCLGVVVISGERTATFLALVVFGMTMLVETKRHKWFAVVALALAMAVAAFVIKTPEIYKRQVEETMTTVENFSGSHYGGIWESAVKIGLDHPFFGIGSHNFREVCLDPKYGPAFRPSGMPRCALHAHNPYLEAFSEEGGIGFVLYAGLCLNILLAWGKGYKENRHSPLYMLLGVYAVARLAPFLSVTSLFHSWAAVPLWLALGMVASYGETPRLTKEQAPS